jgi:hypothetical protein
VLSRTRPAISSIQPLYNQPLPPSSCLTWRLHPPYYQCVTHTSRRHGGVPSPAPKSSLCSPCRRLPRPGRGGKSIPFIRLQPLCALFVAPVLCFQQLAASFHKTPGVGVSPQSSPLESATSSLFFRAQLQQAFSKVAFRSASVPSVSLWQSNSLALFPQLLYFHLHPIYRNGRSMKGRPQRA